jgi:hypothetical protein
MALRFEPDRGMPKGRIARGVRSEYSIWFDNDPGSVAYRQWMLHASPVVPSSVTGALAIMVNAGMSEYAAGAGVDWPGPVAAQAVVASSIFL